MTTPDAMFDETLITKKKRNTTIEYQRFLKEELIETVETYYFCVEADDDFVFYNAYFDRKYRTKNRKKVVGRNKQGVLNLFNVFEEEPELYNLYNGDIFFFVDSFDSNYNRFT
jgi:hypothetical protein